MRHQNSVLEKKLKAAATLDLLIMLDCTGSMAGFINEAKTKIRSFVTSIGQIYPDIQLRIAFVGYRDHCDYGNRLAVLQFTPDLHAFESILARQVATGGGDMPEDIAGALQVASSMKWESELRVLFHIGDSPCHGSEYHDVGDSLPLGDPYGLQPVTFLQSLSKQKVRYLFGVLTNYTDKMLKRFRELLGFDYIRAEPMRDVTMIAVITSSVSSIISETLSQSSSMGTGSEVGALKECEIDEGPVRDWDKVVTEKVVVFALKQPASLEVLCTEEGGGIVEDFPDEACSFVKCAPHPFARGGNKLAYRARNVERPGIATRRRPLTSADTVLKESARSGKAHQAKEKFEEYVAAQRAALFLSAVFCKVRPKSCAAIEFAPIRLLQFLARPTKPFFVEEAFIAGTWERFNNNTGWCAPFPTNLGTHHEAVQAFSHWTHHVSGGRLMITDCQGCYNAERKAFELTDPAVHSVSLLAYGGTNMGKKGFERFFKTHRCNDTCHALKLAPHA